MRVRSLAITAAVSAFALWTATASAAVSTYGSQSEFEANAVDLSSYAIPNLGPDSGGNEDVSPAYTVGPVTFSSDFLEHYDDDDYGNGIAYLGGEGDTFTITSTGNELGLQLGSFYGGAVVGDAVKGSGLSKSDLFDLATTYTYTVNGAAGSITLPVHPDTSFLGFISDTPISVTFANTGRELDAVSFETNGVPSAVPEPSSWLMMIGGFGLIGFAMRRWHKRSEEDFEAELRGMRAVP